MKPTESFFTRLRQKLFKWHLEWEIYNRIAPHIHGEKDCGYLFDCEAELCKESLEGHINTQLNLEIIERQADHMGKAYGEAFRYIMYRDLNMRLLMYLKLAQRRVPPKCRIPRFAT